MADKHVVRFEPVGIEIEVDEDQTILRAAFEQGVMLMHGCKEGSARRASRFVLDGDDIELEKYSTFALPDYEQEEGYTLLCRAHAYEDLTIELLNFDEDMIRSGLPIQRDGRRGRRPTTRSPTTCGTWCSGWSSRRSSSSSPGSTSTSRSRHDATRSFSMANTSSRESGQLEFVIKVYPDGLFSHFLDTQLAVGDRLDISGPFGVFTLRGGRERPDLRRRRRRDGADPVAAALDGRARDQPQGDLLLRRPAAAGTCASRRSCAALEGSLPSFRYVPALSEPADGDGWDGETGLITDVREAARDRPRRTRTPTCAGRRRWSRRRCRCSAFSACPRSASTTTSSPPPAIPANSEEQSRNARPA